MGITIQLKGHPRRHGACSRMPAIRTVSDLVMKNLGLALLKITRHPKIADIAPGGLLKVAGQVNLKHSVFINRSPTAAQEFEHRLWPGAMILFGMSLISTRICSVEVIGEKKGKKSNFERSET
jgi:hypothetical protein